MSFKAACDRWSMIVDPDGAEQGAADDRDAREVHLSQSFGGMWFGKVTLDPISGEIVDTTLRVIERELFDADWAEAKARLGRQPDDPRPAAHPRPAPRRCARGDGHPRPHGAGRRAPPGTAVHRGRRARDACAARSSSCSTAPSLTPGTVAPHLTEADVERIVFDGRCRVLDVGRQRRFFRGALRRGIEVRDRTCFHPSCDEVPERPEIDHIHEASKGGETTQDNGRQRLRLPQPLAHTRIRTPTTTPIDHD